MNDLTRVADALERIASALEARAFPARTEVHISGRAPSPEEIVRAVEENLRRGGAAHLNPKRQ